MRGKIETPNRKVVSSIRHCIKGVKAGGLLLDICLL